MRFCQTVDGFLPNSPFSQICHFCVNRQLSICLFCCFIVAVFAKFADFAKYVIFVKPTIIDMPLLSSCFNFCQTYKFLPNKSPFVQMPFFVILCEYLARDFLAYSPFLPKFLSFAQNLPFSYNRHLSRFPSLSPHLRFCKTFDRFLPISPFSPICHSRENRQLPIGLFCSHLNFLPDL